MTSGGLPVVAVDNSGATDLLFEGNDYWASGSQMRIQWINTTYNTLDGPNGWRANTGQEKVNGSPVGFAINPMLNNPGGGGTIGNADRLNTLTQYQLQSTSDAQHAGLDLSQFHIVWDPYEYANDPFMRSHSTRLPGVFTGMCCPVLVPCCSASEPTN
jgi:hypothetical protein